jgi:hypothetical protein
MTCNKFDSIENVVCPQCARPISVLRGFDASCKPISLIVHRVNLETWRPGTFQIA